MNDPMVVSVADLVHAGDPAHWAHWVGGLESERHDARAPAAARVLAHQPARVVAGHGRAQQQLHAVHHALLRYQQ